MIYDDYGGAQPDVASPPQGSQVLPEMPEFGPAFENYLMHELTTYADYRSGEELHFWRSASGFEVDFIIGDHTAIEVKASRSVSKQDIKPLRALAEEKKLKRYLCVSLDPRPRNLEGVTILPYRQFLEALWAGEYGDS